MNNNNNQSKEIIRNINRQKNNRKSFTNHKNCLQNDSASNTYNLPYKQNKKNNRIFSANTNFSRHKKISDLILSSQEDIITNNIENAFKINWNDYVSILNSINTLINSIIFKNKENKEKLCSYMKDIFYYLYDILNNIISEKENKKEESIFENSRIKSCINVFNSTNNNTNKPIKSKNSKKKNQKLINNYKINEFQYLFYINEQNKKIYNLSQKLIIKDAKQKFKKDEYNNKCFPLYNKYEPLHNNSTNNTNNENKNKDKKKYLLSHPRLNYIGYYNNNKVSGIMNSNLNKIKKGLFRVNSCSRIIENKSAYFPLAFQSTQFKVDRIRNNKDLKCKKLDDNIL